MKIFKCCEGRCPFFFFSLGAYFDSSRSGVVLHNGKTPDIYTAGITTAFVQQVSTIEYCRNDPWAVCFRAYHGTRAFGIVMGPDGTPSSRFRQEGMIPWESHLFPIGPCSPTPSRTEEDGISTGPSRREKTARGFSCSVVPVASQVLMTYIMVASNNVH